MSRARLLQVVAIGAIASVGAIVLIAGGITRRELVIAVPLGLLAGLAMGLWIRTATRS